MERELHLTVLCRFVIFAVPAPICGALPVSWLTGLGIYILF